MMMMMKSVLSLLLLLPTATLAASGGGVKGLKGVSSASSSTASRQLKGKKIDGPEARTCKTSAKSHSVSFSCKSRAAKAGSRSQDDADDNEAQDRGISIQPQDINDKIKYRVKTSNKGVHVGIEYTQKIDDDAFDDLETETETKTGYELIFSDLIEYEKGSDDAESEAYDFEQDTILQQIKLDGFDDFTDIIDDPEAVTSYFSTVMPNGQIGSTLFNFTITRATQNQRLTANNMKIDVRILDFPWQSTNSYLALISTVDAKRKVKMTYTDTATQEKTKETTKVDIDLEEGMSSVGFNAFGTYEWADDALVTNNETTTADFNGTVVLVESRQGDVSEESNIILVSSTEDNNGTTTQQQVNEDTIIVIATTPSDQGDDNFQTIAYSFVGDAAHSASEIYWDPEAGIGYESASFMPSSLLSMIASAAALVYLAW